MDFNISGRHVAVTDAMREHARHRVQKLERFSHRVMRATVTLAIEGERHNAEIVATIRHKGELVAKTESHDMYRAIDEAVAKMEKQLHKLEGRTKDKRNETRGKRGIQETSTEASAPDEADSSEKDEQ